MQNPLLSRKLEIRFIKETTSGLIGNVWIGRVVTLNRSTAERFIDSGYAVEADEGKVTKKKSKTTPTPESEQVQEEVVEETAPDTVPDVEEETAPTKPNNTTTKKKTTRKRKK